MNAIYFTSYNLLFILIVYWIFDVRFHKGEKIYIYIYSPPSTPPPRENKVNNRFRYLPPIITPLDLSYRDFSNDVRYDGKSHAPPRQR